MSTDNICFYGEIRKISILFGWKKKNKKKSVLSAAAEPIVKIITSVRMENLIQVHTIVPQDINLCHAEYIKP